MSGKNHLREVAVLPVAKRENDDKKLSARQKAMIFGLKAIEDQIRNGSVRSTLIITKSKRSRQGYTGCEAQYSLHNWDDLLIMGAFACSSAMKSPASSASIQSAAEES